MATSTPIQTSLSRFSPQRWPVSGPGSSAAMPAGSKFLSWNISQKKSKNKRSLTVVAAVGDVSADGNTYLIAGAAAVALLGTAFPILFSRKDLCPECDGAGFIRKSGAALRANAARKDQAQIVCPRCNGLGKLNQIDK
ncbi:hypothetical protein NC652_016121 [Populus alba x Populus x berolinensis]|uniref:Uncharacterized protein n=4 Tax=Populus TaxID=3689 RepID=A0ACC4C580_POPAL|nr:uncharacterized protein LOC118053402 [Populus alba]KAG6771570.1 hypothetical protein POTOM_022942 [Populus tomentosa]KAJ6922368.1 hypothetical protein NC652_016121 [Populus alba x Populus x berolinensis]KAJ6992879.1 hypothetical protein NC653_016094 [Populus alba x Populus x berolinensis]TKS09661.1 hypothetical protein D5086_0000091730 [Populus alba]